MIIGINGKIGSGKDTVGRIIQYLTSEYDTRYVYADWVDRVENYSSDTYSPWEIKKFAGKLKTTASLLTGIPVEKFEDQEFKKTNLSNEWSIGYGKKLDGSYTDVSPMTVRELLQKLGTEAMRDNLHENVWVNALFADYKPSVVRSADSFDLDTYNGKYPNWIITDMRFPNEMDAVKEREGITIRVTRSCGSSNFEGTQEEWDKLVERNKQALHPSETALDNNTFDYEIINDGTIEDLIEKVRAILVTEDII